MIKTFSRNSLGRNFVSQWYSHSVSRMVLLFSICFILCTPVVRSMTGVDVRSITGRLYTKSCGVHTYVSTYLLPVLVRVANKPTNTSWLLENTQTRFDVTKKVLQKRRLMGPKEEYEATTFYLSGFLLHRSDLQHAQKEIGWLSAQRVDLPSQELS